MGAGPDLGLGTNPRWSRLGRRLVDAAASLVAKRRVLGGAGCMHLNHQWSGDQWTSSLIGILLSSVIYMFVHWTIMH